VRKATNLKLSIFPLTTSWVVNPYISTTTTLTKIAYLFRNGGNGEAYRTAIFKPNVNEAALFSTMLNETRSKRPVLLCNNQLATPFLATFNSKNVARFQSLCASCRNNFWYYDCVFRCLSFCCRTCSYSRLTFDLFALYKTDSSVLACPCSRSTATFW
jgi:hypothetical protein